MKINKTTVEFETYEEAAAIFDAILFYIQNGKDEGVIKICENKYHIFHQLVHNWR